MKFEPYYKVHSGVELNFVVRVAGDRYIFDSLDSAVKFIQMILAYSVSKPVVTLIIDTTEVDK